MIKPTYMRIINDDGYFRFVYKRSQDNLKVTSRGFSNKKELIKILSEDEFFKIKYE